MGYFTKVYEKVFHISMKKMFELSNKTTKDNNDNLSLEEYLNIIRPYLRDMIDNHKGYSKWKIQL